MSAPLWEKPAGDLLSDDPDRLDPAFDIRPDDDGRHDIDKDAAEPDVAWHVHFSLR